MTLNFISYRVTELEDKVEIALEDIRHGGIIDWMCVDVPEECKPLTECDQASPWFAEQLSSYRGKLIESGVL